MLRLKYLNFIISIFIFFKIKADYVKFSFFKGHKLNNYHFIEL